MEATQIHTQDLNEKLKANIGHSRKKLVIICYENHSFQFKSFSLHTQKQNCFTKILQNYYYVYERCAFVLMASFSNSTIVQRKTAPVG